MRTLFAGFEIEGDERLFDLEHDPEKPGLDPEWKPVIGKDSAQTKSRES
jgi:hypothetical protein